MRVNPYNSKLFGLNLGSLSNWLIILAAIWVLGSIGLGWLVNSILILMGLLIAAPLIGFVGLRWWLSRNLIEDQCPVCSHEFTALNQTQVQCPNCSEPLRVEKSHFHRLTPPGTIDVAAVEVSSTSLLED